MEDDNKKMEEDSALEDTYVEIKPTINEGGEEPVSEAKKEIEETPVEVNTNEVTNVETELSQEEQKLEEEPLVVKKKLENDASEEPKLTEIDDTAKDVAPKKKGIVIVLILLGLLAVGALVYFFLLPKNITITFKSGTNIVLTQKIKKGEGVTLPTVDQEDYVFTGWYYHDAKVEEGQVFEEDATVEARWNKIEKTMTITFDTDGGDIIDDMIVKCDSELNLPVPTKEGYTFLDWRDKNDIVISNETKLVCENINLKANWQKVEN